jgi:polysaccharide export outer membrane protein
MDEAQKAIVHKAYERLNNPELTLMLKEFVKPHFTIAGEVSKPGSFEMHGNVSALEAIAMGGGFKDTSNRKQVLLVRKMDTEIASVKVVNFKQLMSNSGASEDFQIRPGDILVVPKTKLGAIEPYIRVSSMAMTGLYGVAVLK